MRHRSRRPSRPYAAIPNAAMRDRRISIEARGLLALLMGYSDDWTFVFSHLQEVTGCGRDKLRRILRELESFGYVVREVRRGDSGLVQGSEWIIVDDPEEGKPEGQAPENPPEVGHEAPNVRDNRPPENPAIGTDPLNNRPPENPTAGESAPIRKPTGKKTNSKNPPTPRAGGEGRVDHLFADFWRAYPKQEEEAAARRAWSRVASAENVDAIILGVEAYAQTDRVRRGFVKLPANWLADRSWESSGPSSPPAGPVDLEALAELWAPKVTAGGYVPPSAISTALAEHMVRTGRVTGEQLRRVGVRTAA